MSVSVYVCVHYMRVSRCASVYYMVCVLVYIHVCVFICVFISGHGCMYRYGLYVWCVCIYKQFVCINVCVGLCICMWMCVGVYIE